MENPPFKRQSDTDQNIRVMIADDHRVMRSGLAAILNREAGLEVIGEASDGDEAISMARELHPDVILMDVRMIRQGGIEATARIREENRDIHIIGLSMYDDELTRQCMLQAGAAAHLCKTLSPRRIIQTVLSVGRAGTRFQDKDEINRSSVKDNIDL